MQSISAFVAGSLPENTASWQAVDSQGQTIWVADAHREGKRYIVRTDEVLIAFLELESAIRARATQRGDNYLLRLIGLDALPEL